jgi:hypothetical protein
MFNPHPTRIAELLQLVTAPAFLIAGIGTFISVLTARLSRVVDRARDEDEQDDRDDDGTREPNPARVEFDRRMRELLATRARLISRAIALATISAILVCLLIAVLFADTVTATDLSTVVALLFIGTVFALVASLIVFLREVFVATSMLRGSYFRPGRGTLKRAA